MSAEASDDIMDGSAESGAMPEGLETAEDLPEQAAGPPPIAELTDVSHRYGEFHALGPLTLRLERGCVGLLGPNGAGKSTLIRILMGLIRPTSGTVRVLGEEVRAGAVGVRRRIGYAPEGDVRFPGLTGVEGVAYAGQLVGMRRVEALQRAHQVLDYVELGEARYRPATGYSTGMRQRLKLAQALVHDPELLILDEPTEGVDPQARDHLLDLIHELVAEHDLQLLVSTHLLHDVERVATHALVLHDGKTVAHGAVKDLKTAGQRGFVVRVRGSPAALVERLNQQRVPFEDMAPGLRVLLDDPREVLAHVEASGLVVRHLAPAELTLEEAYAQAVGGTAHA